MSMLHPPPPAPPPPPTIMHADADTDTDTLPHVPVSTVNVRALARHDEAFPRRCCRRPVSGRRPGRQLSDICSDGEQTPVAADDDAGDSGDGGGSELKSESDLEDIEGILDARLDAIMSRACPSATASDRSVGSTGGRSNRLHLQSESGIIRKQMLTCDSGIVEEVAGEVAAAQELPVPAAALWK